MRPVFDDSQPTAVNQYSFQQCLMSGTQSQFFSKMLGKQHVTVTRLATPSRRRPFSECNKGNRRMTTRRLYDVIQIITPELTS